MKKVETPEQRAISDAKRAATRDRKRLQRSREAEQSAVNELLKAGFVEGQQAIWVRNRARLKPEEIAALETRQDEFLSLLSLVLMVIEELPKGRIGSPDGSPWPDVLYEDCLPHTFADNGGRLVYHLGSQEFHELYQSPDLEIRELMTSHDKNWFEYGFFTKFVTTVWNRFVDTCADYINAHPDETELHPEIKEHILSEWRKHQPRVRPQFEHAVNLERISRPPATPADAPSAFLPALLPGCEPRWD